MSNLSKLGRPKAKWLKCIDHLVNISTGILIVTGVVICGYLLSINPALMPLGLSSLIPSFVKLPISGGLLMIGLNETFKVLSNAASLVEEININSDDISAFLKFSKIDNQYTRKGFEVVKKNFQESKIYEAYNAVTDFFKECAEEYQTYIDQIAIEHKMLLDAEGMINITDDINEENILGEIDYV